MKVGEHMNLSQPVTMSSLEIAELTGKLHKNVLRDIRTMIAELARAGELGSDLSPVTERVQAGPKRIIEVFQLNKKLTYCLVMGYSAVQRMRVLTYIEKLEQALLGQSYQKLQDLTIEMRVSEQLGQMASMMMNKRKKDKHRLKDKESSLLLKCQLRLSF